MAEKVAKRTIRMITSITLRKLSWTWWTMSSWSQLKQTSKTNFQHKVNQHHRIKEEVQTRRNQDSRIIRHHLGATMHIRRSTNHKINHHIKEDTKRNSGTIQTNPPTWKERIRISRTTSQVIRESTHKWGNRIQIRKDIKENSIKIKVTEEDMCKMIMTAWDHQEMSTFNPKDLLAEEKTAIVIMFKKAINIQVQQKINPSNIKPNQVCEINTNENKNKSKKSIKKYSCFLFSFEIS